MPLPPPAPSTDDLAEFFTEKRERLSNIRSAVPYIKWQSRPLRLPGPPTELDMRNFYEDGR